MENEQTDQGPNPVKEEGTGCGWCILALPLLAAAVVIGLLCYAVSPRLLPYPKPGEVWITTHDDSDDPFMVREWKTNEILAVKGGYLQYRYIYNGLSGDRWITSSQPAWLMRYREGEGNAKRIR